MKLADKFGLPIGLMNSVKKVFDESTEYQNKVKAHMAKKGIKSLGDLSPEEKKKFFNDLDAAHKAKNEEFSLSEGMLSKFKKADAQTITAFNKYNMKPYDAVYTVTMGDKGEPKYDLTILKHENGKFLAAHGAVVVKQEFSKAEDAAKWLMNWYEENKRPAAKNEEVDLEEESGGGTNISSTKTIAAQKKRADVAVKIAALKLKQEKEREALQKQKASVKEEFGASVLDESFSSAMVAKLKAEYGKISTIDPSSDSYKKLIAMLDKMDKKDLQTLADAGIKFVSGLAKNRVNRMKNEEVVVDEATGVTDYNAKSQGGTRKELLAKYHKTKNPKDAEAARKAGATQKELQGEEVEIEEGKSSTGYNLYHKDFSSAMAHAYDFAKSKYGIEVDPEEIDRKVAMGPKKPSSGKTNSYRLMGKDGKKAIQVQVANLDNKRYELNMYKEEVEITESDDLGPVKKDKQKTVLVKHKTSGKEKVIVDTPENRKKNSELGFHPVKEEVELDERVIKGKGYDNPENERKAPEGKVPTTSLMPGHDDRAARFAAVQAKGRLVKGKAQSAPQKEESDYPEFKQGGEALAKKFEKAFAKMGVKANIKMKTVGNVSVNEAVMKKISKAAKKMKEQAPSNKDVSKSGEPLSGKKEPIEINPEIQQSK